VRKYFWLLPAVLLPYSQNVQASTEISAEIKNSTTWTVSGSPYVLLDSIRLDYLDTLTIEAGVVVKPKTASSGLIVYGILNLQGTEDNPVVFTSFKDDTYGGDTNEDGFETLPAPQDWGRVWIRNTWQDIVLQHAIFRYGGAIYESPIGEIYGALTLNGTLTRIQDCLFEYNMVDLYLRNCSPQIENCTFDHAPEGSYSIYVHADSNIVARPKISGNTFKDVDWPFHQYGNSFPEYAGNEIGPEVRHKGIFCTGLLAVDSTSTFTLGKFQGDASIPYVFEVYQIPKNVTLNIEAGVVLKIMLVQPENMLVDGKLNLQGTEEEPVVFTSFNDDSYGGDTNGDGNLSTPSPGDWGSIAIRNDLEDTPIQNAKFRFGGGDDGSGGDNGVLKLEGVSPVIRNCDFSDNENGVLVDEGSPTIEDCNFEHGSNASIHVKADSTSTARPTIANNSFSDVEWPVHQEGNSFPVYSGNDIDSSVEHKGILLSGTVDSDTLKTETLEKFQGASGVPYVIDGEFTITVNVTLDIEAGVVIKMQDSLSSLEVEGVLNPQGTEGSPVVFTSLKDDSYGGDTNGDGYKSTPSPGDWSGVNLNNDTRDSQIENVVFKFAGADSTSPGAINIESGSPRIENCRFEENEAGVYNSGDGNPVVNNCDFIDNPTGIENANDETTMDSKNNYWGDSSGPTADSNPDGAGAAVVGNVDYSDFLTEPAVPAGRGDLNQDNSIDVGDLVRVINIILERGPSPTPTEYRAADANGDGKLDIADLVKIIDIILGRDGGLMLASASKTFPSPAAPAAADGLKQTGIALSGVIDIAQLEPVVALAVELAVDSRLTGLTILSGDRSITAAGNRIAGHPQNENQDIYRFLVFSTSNKTLNEFLSGISFSFVAGENRLLQADGVLEPLRFEIVDIQRIKKDLTGKTLSDFSGDPDRLRAGLPRAFSLEQNYPNPFNPSTSISFSIPSNVPRARVSLSVYDTRGALVATLVDMVKSPGTYQVHWDGTGSSGRTAPSGVYFYRLETESSAFTRKMVLLR